MLDIGTLIRKDARFDAFLKRDLALHRAARAIARHDHQERSYIQGASGVSPPTDFPSIHELVPGGVQGLRNAGSRSSKRYRKFRLAAPSPRCRSS